jgi:acetylornithine deacetylase
VLDLVQTLRDLVAIPSVNPMGQTSAGGDPAESKLTDYLEGLLRGLGIRVVRQQVEPGRDNLLAVVEASPATGRNQRLILFEAHQDTVPGTGMTIPPFTPDIRDGRLYGRGSCDVKGGMAAMLAALARLHRERPNRMPTVVLACTVDEEFGFRGATAVTTLWQPEEKEDTKTRSEHEERRKGEKGEGRRENAHHSPRFAVSPLPSVLSLLPSVFPRTPDCAVVAEPTELEVVVAHKGVVRWRCRARGLAAHSATPGAGDNAIYRMARVLAAIEKYAQDVVATLGTHPLCGPATLNVGTIAGGVSVNTVPDTCTIEIDRRMVPHETHEAARQHLIDYLEGQAGLGFALEHDAPFLQALPLADEHNRPLADRLVAAASGLVEPCRAVGVPYGTDAAVFAAAGVPTVVFGPGSIAQAHTADEWIALDQVQKAAEVYYRFAKSFC